MCSTGRFVGTVVVIDMYELLYCVLADIGKAKNLGESNQSSQDSHENDISKTVLSKPEVENETIRVGNKGIQPFDRVYLRKKKTSKNRTK